MKIEFSKDQLIVLNSAICELPYRIAAPLINHINAEIQKAFDMASGDGPTGQTPAPDELRGDV